MKYVFNFVVNFFIAIPFFTLMFMFILVFDDGIYKKNLFKCGDDDFKIL